ncbi:hypothetical protein HK104_001768 [Borealophlyctis nickersoniae]|nr:hypothetical protein HK104_001768 [Borealophlyctis nickersoniae]
MSVALHTALLSHFRVGVHLHSPASWIEVDGKKLSLGPAGGYQGERKVGVDVCLQPTASEQDAYAALQLDALVDAAIGGVNAGVFVAAIGKQLQYSRTNHFANVIARLKAVVGGKSNVIVSYSHFGATDTKCVNLLTDRYVDLPALSGTLDHFQSDQSFEGIEKAVKEGCSLPYVLVIRIEKTGTKRTCGHLILVDLVTPRFAPPVDVMLAGARGSNLADTISTMEKIATMFSRKGLEGELPYRSSPITDLCAECLGGNARSTMVLHIDPSEPSSAMEVHHALEFGNLMRDIKTREVTQLVDPRVKDLEEKCVALLEDLDRMKESSERCMADLTAEHSQQRRDAEERAAQLIARHEEETTALRLENRLALETLEASNRKDREEAEKQWASTLAEAEEQRQKSEKEWIDKLAEAENQSQKMKEELMEKLAAVEAQSKKDLQKLQADAEVLELDAKLQAAKATSDRAKFEEDLRREGIQTLLVTAQRDDLQKEVADFQDIINDLQRQMEDVNNAYDSIACDMEASQHAHETLKRAHEEALATIQRLQAEAIARTEEVERERESMTDEIAELLQRTKNQVEHIKGEKNDALAVCDELREEIAELKATLKNHQTEIEERKKRAEQTEHDMARERELLKRRGEEALENANAQAARELEKARRDAEKAVEKVESDAAREKEKLIREYEKAARASEKDFEKLQRESEKEIETERESWNRQRRKLEMELDEAKQRESARLEEVESARREAESSRREAESARREAEGARREADGARREADEERRRVQDVLTRAGGDRNAQIELEKARADYEGLYNEAKQREKLWVQQRDALRKQLADAQAAASRDVSDSEDVPGAGEKDEDEIPERRDEDDDEDEAGGAVGRAAGRTNGSQSKTLKNNTQSETSASQRPAPPAKKRRGGNKRTEAPSAKDVAASTSSTAPAKPSRKRKPPAASVVAEDPPESERPPTPDPDVEQEENTGKRPKKAASTASTAKSTATATTTMSGTPKPIDTSVPVVNPLAAKTRPSIGGWSLGGAGGGGGGGSSGSGGSSASGSTSFSGLPPMSRRSRGVHPDRMAAILSGLQR